MQIREDGRNPGSEVGGKPLNREALLAEITAICKPLTPVQDDEVTVADMSAIWSYSPSTTQTVLDRQVEAGELTRRKALNAETGRECWAYRLVVS